MGAGCVMRNWFLRVGRSVCVRLFRLMCHPLQGPVIKPLCTQPQSQAYIYLIQRIHERIHTHTNTNDHEPLSHTKYDATPPLVLHGMTSDMAVFVIFF